MEYQEFDVSIISASDDASLTTIAEEDKVPPPESSVTNTSFHNLELHISNIEHD